MVLRRSLSSSEPQSQRSSPVRLYRCRSRYSLSWISANQPLSANERGYGVVRGGDDTSAFVLVVRSCACPRSITNKRGWAEDASLLLSVLLCRRISVRVCECACVHTVIPFRTNFTTQQNNPLFVLFVPQLWPCCLGVRFVLFRAPFLSVEDLNECNQRHSFLHTVETSI